MMKKLFRTFVLAVSIVAAGAIVSNAQTVRGSIANGTIMRGTPTRATVVLSIPGGYHAGSYRPGNEYMIATRLTASAQGAKIGPVTYPRGRDRNFGFSSGRSINVYEGRVTFTFPVTVPASFTGNSVKVHVAVKVQTCNDETCNLPERKNLTLTARVK
jgi:hypothetical protein